MQDGKHLLLVATTTGYQTRTFAQAAARLGVRCTLATDRCKGMDDPWGDHAIAVRFQDPIGSLEGLDKEGPFDGVAALGDKTTFLAALYAERAGLPFHPAHAIEAARSKYLSKERFRAAGLLQPHFMRIELNQDPAAAAASTQYPCVLKPLGLSGSRGVIRVDNRNEFVAAFERIRTLLDDPDIRRMKDQQNRFLQVESYIAGAEFALEGIVTNGQLRVVALFDKPDPLIGPYFEETIYVTPSRQPSPVQDGIVDTIRRGVEALGLRHGPVHAEVRVNEEGVWLLEIAGRPIGGYCGKALRFEGGVPLEEILLRHALGEDVECCRLEPGASGVMMIPIPKAGIYHGVGGVEEAVAVPGVEDVSISATPGQRLKTYPEASSYLGFVFARGERPAEVEDSLRRAHLCLRFEIMTVLA